MPRLIHPASSVFTVLMALLLCLALPGCGRDESAEVATTGGGGVATGEKPVIGVSIQAADHGWTAGAGSWATQAMEEYPEVQWRYQTAANPEKQQGDLRAMVQQGIDALVILPTESEPMTPIAKELHDAGLFIINVDRGFTRPAADVFIQGDNVAFGRMSAEYIVQKLGGDGNIVILRGNPSTVVELRHGAAMKVFDAAEGVRVLATQPANWDRDKARDAVAVMLQQHPQIDAVWASDDDMALGAEQAIREAGREGEMWILGGAGMKDIVKRVMDNDPMYPADITYPPAMIAAGIHVAAGRALGLTAEQVHERIPAHLGMTLDQVRDAMAATHGAEQVAIELPVQLVTPENAEAFYFEDSAY